MSPIYGYIPADKILSVHNYSEKNKIHTFKDVLFRTSVSPLCEFQTPIGVVDSKIISTTNKQLSFLPAKLGHFLGHEYGHALQDTYMRLLADDSPIEIETPVFQFFDYESVSGTGHSYDLMFYLLYVYKQEKNDSKLLVVNSKNTYYNNALNLIKKYYNVEYVYIDPDKTYQFKDFSCVQSYQNIFFHEVKAFMNDTLIKPIIDKYTKINASYPKNAYKIKTKNSNTINRLNSEHTISDSMHLYFKENAYLNLDTVDDEYRIYLLNMAEKLVISWGSNFYINVDYYILDPTNKHITIIFHPNIASEMGFLHIQGDTIRHNMPSWASGNYTNQVYNTLTFKGRVLMMDTIAHL
jgi:hypothetical protein